MSFGCGNGVYHVHPATRSRTEGTQREGTHAAETWVYMNAKIRPWGEDARRQKGKKASHPVEGQERIGRTRTRTGVPGRMKSILTICRKAGEIRIRCDNQLHYTTVVWWEIGAEMGPLFACVCGLAWWRVSWAGVRWGVLMSDGGQRMADCCSRHACSRQSFSWDLGG